MIKHPKYIRSDRSEMIRFVRNRPRAVLEIGCHEGLFSRLLKDHMGAVETWGVEIDAQTAEEAQLNVDHLVAGRFPECGGALPRNHFDLIVFNDVLEHMYDPWWALDYCHELLSNAGVLLSSIPNIRHKWLLKKLIFHDSFEYSDSGILDISHIRFFTKSSMIKMFENVHYKVVDIQPVITVNGPLARILSALFPIWIEPFFVNQYAVTAKRGISED